MQKLQTMTDKQYLAQIERARRMTGSEKIQEGLRLFEEECEKLRQEFRSSFPLATEAEIYRMLSDRISLVREEEYRELYHPFEAHEVVDVEGQHN